MKFGLLSVAIFLGIMSASCSIPVDAQTLFEIPNVTPRYKEYKYLDECDAAVRRLLNEAKARSDIWLDTARFDPARLLQPVPDYVANAAKTCIENVDMDTIKAELVLPAAVLLLASGRDADVRQLFTRVYTSADPVQKGLWLLGFMKLYAASIPLRLEPMKELYEIAASQPWEDTTQVHLIEIGATLSLSAYNLGDTSFARKLGSEIIGKYVMLGRLARESKAVMKTMLRNLDGWTVPWDVYRVVNESALLDSLSASREAYENYMINRMVTFGIDTTLMGPDLRRRLNKEVLALPSDVRFQALGNIHGDSMQEYRNVPKDRWYEIPVKGKVNLIAYLPGGCHRSRPTSGYAGVAASRNNYWGFGADCASVLAVLRRLKQKFPDIELTVSSRTFGNVGYSVPLTPKQEADTLAKYFLGFHKLEGNFLVTYTEWFRLPGNPLDGRRIDLPDSRDSLAGHEAVPVGWMIAVDQDGRVWKRVAGNGWKKREELELEQEIRAVLRRGTPPSREHAQAADSGKL